MKRILFVTSNLVLGGAEKQVVELANGLSRRGFKIAILVFGTRGSKGARIKDLDTEILLMVPESQSDCVRISLRKGVYETVKAVVRWKPDVLYSRLWNTNIFAVLAGRLFGIKVVLGVANSVVRKAGWSKRGTVGRLFRKKIYGFADAVVAVSEGLAREVRDVYELTNVKVVCNGIDIEGERARVRRYEGGGWHEYFRNDVPVIVSAGRFVRQKGFGHLLEAFAIVCEETEVRLLMVGDGDLRDELVGKAKALGIYGRMAMVGETEACAYVNHGDVFVSSSLHEGMPNVILEAMALGTPVVATDCDYGPGEIIENGKNGLLVPVAEPAELASAILLLVRNEELRLRMSTEAEKHLWRFSLDRMISGYEKIFLNA